MFKIDRNTFKFNFDKSRFSKDILTRLLLFVIVDVVLMLIFSTYFKVITIDSLFKTNEFKEFCFGNLFSIVYLAVSYTLSPYIIFIIFSNLIALVLFYKRSKMIRLFIINIIAITISFLIYFGIIFIYISLNLDLLIFELMNIPNDDLTIFNFLEGIMLNDYRESPKFLSLIVYYFVIKFSNQNIFFTYDIIILIIIFLIVFIILFILFDKNCSCSIHKSQIKIPICSKREITLLILFCSFFFLFFFNITQIYNSHSINYLTYDNYYDLSNQDFYLNNNSTNFCETELIKENYIVNFMDDNYTINNIREFNTTIRFNDSELIYNRIYNIGSQNNINYITMNKFQMVSNFTSVPFNDNGKIYPISSFWDNIIVIFYMMDNDNNTAYGYRLSNKESTVKTDIRTMDVYLEQIGNNITINYYDLNISCHEDFQDYTVWNSKPDFLFDISLEDFGISLDDFQFEYEARDGSLFPMHNMLSHYSFSTTIQRVGLYIYMNASTFCDFDFSGDNEEIYIIESNAFAGVKNSYNTVIDSITRVDIITTVIFIGLVVISIIFINADKEFKKSNYKCNVSQYEKREEKKKWRLMKY